MRKCNEKENKQSENKSKNCGGKGCGNGKGTKNCK